MHESTLGDSLDTNPNVRFYGQTTVIKNAQARNNIHFGLIVPKQYQRTVYRYTKYKTLQWSSLIMTRKTSIHAFSFPKIMAHKAGAGFHHHPIKKSSITARQHLGRGFDTVKRNTSSAKAKNLEEHDTNGFIAARCCDPFYECIQQQKKKFEINSFLTHKRMPLVTG